ncbi:MAG: hypothetical protein IKM97_04415 [Clostridia bacterium]|nr:hypothetical protein [Clostridia bacterium]
MKKNLLTIFIIFFIIMAVLLANYMSLKRKNQEIKKFNYGFEFYNKDNLNGLEITTIINKAIDNNEKYGVQKDKNGYYLEDENSIKIEIKMIINDKVYQMERINDIGLESFTEFFGEVNFKCTGIEYHKENNKVSKMIFESTEY